MAGDIPRAIAGRRKNLLPGQAHAPFARRSVPAATLQKPFIGVPVSDGPIQAGADTAARQTFWRREREDEASSLAEPHKRPGSLSDFILGSQDGIVNVLGVLLGVAVGSWLSKEDPFRIILAGGLAATFAESISMGAVAYTTTLARREHYLGEMAREKREMDTLPHIEREEIRQILETWDFHAQELEEMTDRIVAKPKAWLQLMMAHELNLAPIEATQPVRSSILVFLAALIGSFLPLAPFIGVWLAIPGPGDAPAALHARIIWGSLAAVLVSAIILYAIGWYKAKVTLGRPLRSGLQMTLIGVTSAIAGFGIAWVVTLVIGGA